MPQPHLPAILPTSPVSLTRDTTDSPPSEPEHGRPSLGLKFAISVVALFKINFSLSRINVRLHDK